MMVQNHRKLPSDKSKGSLPLPAIQLPLAPTDVDRVVDRTAILTLAFFRFGTGIGSKTLPVAPETLLSIVHDWETFENIARQCFAGQRAHMLAITCICITKPSISLANDGKSSYSQYKTNRNPFGNT